MLKYMLTGIDEVKWKKFKAACDLQGITIKESFTHHINYIIVKVLSEQIKQGQDSLKQKKAGKTK